MLLILKNKKKIVSLIRPPLMFPCKSSCGKQLCHTNPTEILLEKKDLKIRKQTQNEYGCCFLHQFLLFQKTKHILDS